LHRKINAKDRVNRKRKATTFNKVRMIKSKRRRKRKEEGKNNNKHRFFRDSLA